MASLLTPLLWSFLPSQITHQILPYLSSSLPGIFPSAQRGSPTYLRNYRLAFTGVICTYLAYTFYKGEGGQDFKEDYYALLDVNKGVDEDGLKRAYRNLSRLYHPDRAGSGKDDIFILIRRAYETLQDPVKRYAYDRFGPQIIDWKSASVREYIITGLNHSIGFYVVSGGFMLLLSLLGKAREGSYWRHTLFIFLLLSELTLILSPTSSQPFLARLPRLLHYAFPILDAPQFIQITFLHRLFTTISIAINQLTSVWCPSPPPREAELEKVLGMLRQLEMESVTSFQGEVVPLMSAGDPKIVEGLIQGTMEDILVERSISSHPQIRQAYQAALLKPIPRVLRTQPQRGFGYPDPARQLEIARNIPLPPSPPPSPRLNASWRT
ncbi:hypothetical protein I302_104312 [Kwoniella bestiolae CBS 10118]|uniref:J domain-containing protein n=1 Tax=Kwoniella bestiolae CBS 10118 TaxID=1296100 RepID=A0A1B9GAY0_9TREE|nr:hypothetical protein I302_03020 [Kwoniella bestiolae CBS 10118]OCF28169.1 hypothetical protein I302_03020 [Kwoniella bestiolae CBS 10118]